MQLTGRARSAIDEHIEELLGEWEVSLGGRVLRRTEKFWPHLILIATIAHLPRLQRLLVTKRGELAVIAQNGSAPERTRFFSFKFRFRLLKEF